MQGQDGNPFPGNFYLDYGSNGIHLRWSQNNHVRAEDLLCDGHPVVGRMAQSSSTMNNQTHLQFSNLFVEDGLPSNRMGLSSSSMNRRSSIQFQDILVEDGSSSSPFIGSVIDQSLVERHPEPMGAPSQLAPNMNLGNDNLANIPLSLELASSSLLSQNIDLNAAGDSHDINVYLNSGRGLCANPFEPGMIDASSNSDPLVISSGIAGYVVEENDNEEGHSSDGRRLSCKRRAPEDGFRYFSIGESSRSDHLNVNAAQENNSSRRLNLSAPLINHSNVQYSEQPGVALLNGLRTNPFMHQPSGVEINGLEPGARISSNVHQTLRVVGESENSYRNIRTRRTLNHQDFASPDLAWWPTRNSYAQFPGQPDVGFPFDHVPNVNTSSVTGIVHSTHTPQSIIAPNPLEAFQPFQWNAITRSRIGMLPATHASNGDVLLPEDNPSYNIPSNVIVPLEIDRRNVEHMFINVNPLHAANSPRNIASNSINSGYSCTHPSLGPIRFSQGNMAEQSAQRITDIVSGTGFQGQGCHRQLNFGVNLAARERQLSPRGGNFRPSVLPVRSGLIARPERQNDVHPEMAFRSLTTAQRRSRLISEVRNALALVRRGGSLQFEDVMVIDNSFLYGVPEEPDLHDDMRLDVDSMSYEELLDLEDRIGNVCTGISEEAIHSRMKRQKYRATKVGSRLEVEPCCICQEEYADGQDLGKLDCGHDFHFNCIKQWLIQKNICPICKMTALQV